MIDDKQENYQNLPHWFTFVVKWFAHGVNGPFGSVNKISKDYMTAFYDNNADLAKVVTKSAPRFILPAADVLSFMQNDQVNCGICCLMFLIDLVASQVDTSEEGKLNSEN